MSQGRTDIEISLCSLQGRARQDPEDVSAACCHKGTLLPQLHAILLQNPDFAASKLNNLPQESSCQKSLTFCFAQNAIGASDVPWKPAGLVQL